MSGLKCPLQWDVSSDLLSWIKSLIIWEAICIHKFKISLKETVPSGKTLPASRCRTRELQRCQDSAEGCQGAKRCCADTWKEPLHILERSGTFCLHCQADNLAPKRGVGWESKLSWNGFSRGLWSSAQFPPSQGNWDRLWAQPGPVGTPRQGRGVPGLGAPPILTCSRCSDCWSKAGKYCFNKDLEEVMKLML